MKYRIYALALLLLSSCRAEDVSGRSVFVDFMNFDLYSTTGYTLIVNQQHGKGHADNKPEICLSLFGGKSTEEGQFGLGKYFGFDGKQKLSVEEAIPTTPAEELAQDILAGDFNLDTDAGTYTGNISFHPEQKSLGFMISMRYPFADKYWVSVDAPFMHLKQTVGLREERTSAVSTASNDNPFKGTTRTVVNMYEAFRQPGMEYGRIDGTMKKDGMADLKIRIGRNAYDREDLFISQYLGVIIPTGNRRTAVHVWEPILGNGHHVGIDWGNTIQMCMHEASVCNWWVTNSLTGQYLFENTQKRSLDLYNGQWTRYLAMYANSTDRSNDIRSFGINHMTKDVLVNPGVSLGMATQLSVVGKNWNINVGIMNRFREAEDVQLKDAWEEGPMIANIGTVAAVGTGEVIPTRAMGRGFDYTGMVTTDNVYITEDDINLESASHPTVFSTTIHASYAYFYEGEDFSQNYEVGASYDTARNNAGVHRWNLFGKLLLTF